MKKILIIEDTHDVRENIAEILELYGYQALEAKNGKEGVSLAIEHIPDLILCDIMMPELDGFGVLKILDNNKATQDIPFIFLTAMSEQADFRKGMNLGADDYITKPFNDSELLEVVDLRLNKSEQKTEVLDKEQKSLAQFFSESNGQGELALLTEVGELRSFQAKDFIYSQDSTPRYLYFIVSGSVKTFQINEYGKELITHVYKTGDFFGYNPLIANTKYMDSGVALEEASLRLIPKSDFILLLFNNRDFTAQFIKMISMQAEETDQNLIELAYSSVRRKVARALITFDFKRDDEASILSREDLAAKAGTAKETLIRTLSDFRSEGIIEVQNGMIEIINEDELLQMPQ